MNEGQGQIPFTTPAKHDVGSCRISSSEVAANMQSVQAIVKIAGLIIMHHPLRT